MESPMHLAKAIDERIMKSELIALRGTTVTVSNFKRIMKDILDPYGARAVVRREKFKEKNRIRIAGRFASFVKRERKIDIIFNIF